jgi:TolB-like protein
MSGDREQEYFADGMVEEIITALSRIRWLFVIARNSTIAYKNQAVDVKRVSRELGVRYVLEGSVRKAGERVRITAQLIEAETGAHVWADRFDGSLDHVFDLQDQVATGVVGVIEPTLRQAEIERARRKRPDNLDAYDLYLRAWPLAFVAMPEAADKALHLLDKPSHSTPNTARRTRSSRGATMPVTSARGSPRKQGLLRSATRASRSPRAATTPRLSPLPASSSALSNETTRPPSMLSIDHWR